MVTQYVVLAVPDAGEARQLVQDMHRYVSEPILTPSANSPIHAVFISQGTDPPDLQQPDWAAAMQTSLDRIERQLMSQQSDVDAITTSLAGIQSDLTGVHDELSTGIQNLEDELAAKGVSVDLSALTGVRDQLAGVRDALKTQADAVPQPTPPPAP